MYTWYDEVSVFIFAIFFHNDEIIQRNSDLSPLMSKAGGCGYLAHGRAEGGPEEGLQMVERKLLAPS